MAHRISAVTNSDRVMVINDGSLKVIYILKYLKQMMLVIFCMFFQEFGQFDDLLKNSGTDCIHQ